ncbi:DNA-binding transcriptional regulator, AcrR family [Amycolatopsis saalfeldensis]|uniref:DNA-binding transcriptional regulator, AcrR family n=2 Tax=Amycolatopsis saalfeldensis TaxID=394193 RepID=A0A1H8YJ19_9PSEU|nr:DNA-binding transcriptional regulator, AcrR family [Amycolatopsis saalfeldensis]
MTPVEAKRRAPGMAPEDRRQMIVRAVLPLVVEHGAAVTTSQIARAAGIGEGTIFRAFKDKDELIDACVVAALDPGESLEIIGEIPGELPLEKRLLEAVEALTAHLQRIGAVMASVHKGRARPEHLRSQAAKGGDSRRESVDAMRVAIEGLFEPDAAKLRLPLDKTASLFLSMLFSMSRPMPDGPSPAETIDLFLHGAVSA